MRESVLILGAGGHCRVILDMLFEDVRYDISGLVANTPDAVLGIPVIGTDNDLPALLKQGIGSAFVGIGNNAVRKKLSEYLIGLGFSLINVISRHAVISKFVTMGVGNVIMPGAIVNSGSVLGNGCIVNTNASVDHDCKIADFVHIAPGCALSGNVAVGEGSFLGTGANVIDGMTVGRRVMIGAGAVVVTKIPSDCTAVGVPARVIKQQQK